MFLSEWLEFFRRLALQGGKKILDYSSRLDVVEIARVPDMLPSLFPLLVGLRTYQHPGSIKAAYATSIINNQIFTA